MRWTGGSTLVALSLASAREATAQAPPLAPAAELDYQVAAGLTCPTVEDLRADVAKEMKYDAFAQNGVPGARVGRFNVIVSRGAAGALLIRLSFDDPSGKEIFDTDFEGTPPTARTCNHLVRKHVVTDIVTELTLQMARQARELARRTACSEQTSGAARPPYPDSRFSLWPTEWPLPPLHRLAPDPPKPPETAPVALRIGGSVWPELIANGWGSFGVSIEAGARYHAFSLGVEAHGDPPLGAVAVQNVGEVSFARVSGALLLCGHWGWFTGCGVGDAGRFLFPVHGQVLPASAFYGAAAVRVGLEFPVTPQRVFLRAAVDLRAPLHPADYVRAGTTIFEAAGPSVGLGLGLLTELPL